MNSKILSLVIGATLGLASMLGTSEAFAAANVYPLQVLMKGAIQGSSSTGPVFLRENLTGNDLINLARGRALDTPVPTNEVLGLAVDCDNSLIAMIVYNTSNSAILAIVAELEIEKSARQNSSALYILEMNMEFGGNDTNAIDSGEFLLAGRASLINPSSIQCFYTLDTRGLGTIRIVSQGQAIDLLVTSASVKTVGKTSIGTADLVGF